VCEIITVTPAPKYAIQQFWLMHSIGRAPSISDSFKPGHGILRFALLGSFKSSPQIPAIDFANPIDIEFDGSSTKKSEREAAIKRNFPDGLESYGLDALRVFRMPTYLSGRILKYTRSGQICSKKWLVLLVGLFVGLFVGRVLTRSLTKSRICLMGISNNFGNMFDILKPSVTVKSITQVLDNGHSIPPRRAKCRTPNEGQV